MVNKNRCRQNIQLTLKIIVTNICITWSYVSDKRSNIIPCNVFDNTYRTEKYIVVTLFYNVSLIFIIILYLMINMQLDIYVFTFVFNVKCIITLLKIRRKSYSVYQLRITHTHLNTHKYKITAQRQKINPDKLFVFQIRILQ